MEQRLVGLAFTSLSGVLTVNLPPNSNVAPLGYYMLFILNSAGVPSVASFVQVSSNPTDQPPKGTITAPTGDMTITAGQAVNFGATANDPDGSLSASSWYSPGATPTTSTALNPGVVTFPTAGTSVGSLTVVDNVGLNDPSPTTRTITVQPAVQITSPSAGSTVNGVVSSRHHLCQRRHGQHKRAGDGRRHHYLQHFRQVVWPAIHQIGQGYSSANVSIPMTGTTTYPGLFLDPVYVWGNTGGTNYNALQLTNFGIDQCGNGLSSAQFIVSGRDVFLGTVNPGYTFTYPHPFTRRFSTANSSASAYTYTNACVCYTGSFVDTISNHHQFELYFGIRNVDLGGG